MQPDSPKQVKGYAHSQQQRRGATRLHPSATARLPRIGACRSEAGVSVVVGNSGAGGTDSITPVAVCHLTSVPWVAAAIAEEVQALLCDKKELRRAMRTYLLALPGSRLADFSADDESVQCVAAERLAERPSTQVALLSELAVIDDAGVKSNVATNPNTTAATLGMLASTDDEFVRRAVATSSNLDLITALRLSRDSRLAVTQALSQNPQVPLAVRIRLLDHPGKSVRDAVAEHIGTYNANDADIPEEVLVEAALIGHH